MCVCVLSVLCGHRQAGRPLLQWYRVEGQGQQRVVETYVHIDHDPSNSSYAVCICGYRGEAILYDKMFRHYRDFVFTPDTDLFLFIETSNRIVSHNGTLGTDFDLSRLRQLYGPCVWSFVVTNGHDIEKKRISSVPMLNRLRRLYLDGMVLSKIFTSRVGVTQISSSLTNRSAESHSMLY